MDERSIRRRIAVAACALACLAAVAGCHGTSSSTAGGSGSVAGATGTAGAKGTAGGGSASGAGSGGGVCADVTKDQVAALFTGTVGDGVPGHFSDPGSPPDCLFPLNGDKDLGLTLVSGPDNAFWAGQFTEHPAVSGIGDSAWYGNNGLVVFAKKGSATCAAEMTVSSMDQVNAPSDGGFGIAASARDAFVAKLGALCTTVLG